MNEKFDPNATHNPPGTGILVRNPTHREVAEYARDQRDIVESIKETAAKWQIAVYDYSDKGRIPGLPGILKIRELSETNMVEFCKTLLRVKPSITGIKLKLGDYPGARPYTGPKLQRLRSRHPRNPTDLAKDFAELLADRSLNIVEVNYTIDNITPGQFSTSASAVMASQVEYEKDENFQPYLEIEFLKL